MTPREIDEAEWRDPANWHAGWLGIYFSRRDRRAWVPKRNPVYGWTVNFASRSGVLTLVLLLALPIFITIFALLAAS